MNLSILAAVGGIALVDVVLSGDNALVIGAAASKLPRGQRLVAVAWGGLGAIVLRLILAAVATELLTVEYLRAAGGVVLLFITVRLLIPESQSKQARPAADRFLHAIVTIMLADMTMSLDNVLAVGALAAGNIPLLFAGLILSMVLLFVASTLVARLMEHFTWLLDVAAVVLGWTAANLILEDPAVASLVGLKGQSNISLAIHFAFIAVVLIIDLCLRAYVLHKKMVLVGGGKAATDVPTAAVEVLDTAQPVAVPDARASTIRPGGVVSGGAAPEQSSIVTPSD